MINVTYRELEKFYKTVDEKIRSIDKIISSINVHSIGTIVRDSFNYYKNVY